MYQIYLTNFQYFKEGKFNDMEAVKVECKRICFDCCVYEINGRNKKLVATYEVLSGFRSFI